MVNQDDKNRLIRQAIRIRQEMAKQKPPIKKNKQNKSRDLFK